MGSEAVKKISSRPTIGSQNQNFYSPSLTQSESSFLSTDISLNRSAGSLGKAITSYLFRIINPPYTFFRGKQLLLFCSVDLAAAHVVPFSVRKKPPSCWHRAPSLPLALLVPFKGPYKCFLSWLGRVRYTGRQG